MKSHHDHSSAIASPDAAQDFLRRFFIVSGLLILLFIFGRLAQPLLQFLIATIIFYFGLIFLQHAKHELIARQYGMMTLVAIAITAGYLFSAVATFLPSLNAEFYLEISTLIWILLFGHYLEAKSAMAAGNALDEVTKLLPLKARLVKKDQVKKVAIQKLKSADVVRVLAGEKTPADGKIIKGAASFDEAHLSGESKPVAKAQGDLVMAGSVCLTGSVDVRLLKVGANSTIGQLQQLIAQASMTKPTTQKLADRAASWLTVIALSVSMLTLVTWLLIGSSVVFATTLAITVLVITCPHALGLAIPTVTTMATKLAVQNGLFIKDMGKLEVIQGADYIVFDKTGTLTKGEFAVAEVKAKQGSKAELLTIAASIEAHANHPIAQAIRQAAQDKKLQLRPVKKVKNIVGKGIAGEIDGQRFFVGQHQSMSVAVVTNKKVIGEILLADELKSESYQAVEKLRDLGLKVAMLTGDSQEIAQEVAHKLKLKSFFAQVKPQDKYQHIKSLQDKGKVVIMVGDGVNDAAALTQADVGVAIGAGTDIAVEAGDIVLTDSNPQDLVSLVVLARKVYRKMIENLIWALGYNVVAIPAAAGLFIPLGFSLTPAIGALLMSLSSVIVVINALTLKKIKLGRFLPK
ncbi:MAG: cadmium-translocating P-type ATPase [Candidatus Pacebacteria bacterium]|nr:cadmium-translocating P-type ATPase [Candidatus Paceibacterota bacterium]